MNETVFRCAGCDAAVEFNPEQQNLKCPYCGLTQAIEGLSQAEFQEELDLESSIQRFSQLATEEIRIVVCQSCNGETTFAVNHESGTCDFCGTKIVATGPTSKAMKPQYLLPFAIKQDKAETAFRTWLKKRWFAPSDLKRLAGLKDPLSGIYFPFWTFDAQTHSHYDGERGDHYTVQVQSRDSQGNSVTRSETRTRWTAVSGNTERFFDDVLVPGSKNLPEKLTKNLKDWNLKEMVSYNPAVLSGFKSETYSLGLKEGFAEGKEEMETIIHSDVRRAIGGDEQRIRLINTRYSEMTFKYIQLPMWSLTYKYGKKFFQVLVNGRSGEVSGERPWSVIKITLTVLLIAGLGVGLYFLAEHLGWFA